MRDKIFIDTSYVLALFNQDDSYHAAAKRWAPALFSEQFLTSQAILLEIGNAFSKITLRKSGVGILRRFEQDEHIEIIPHSPELHEKAMQMYESRMDKEWGLIDCVSFVIMQNNHVTQALTSDSHFKQAGFRALLLE
ncbi:MAG: type II toxin-antitoxin system VapC family toxin [bacterium]|nr:type II toxin-antitoxin system VapC family toxin [bacterium]